MPKPDIRELEHSIRRIIVNLAEHGDMAMLETETATKAILSLVAKQETEARIALAEKIKEALKTIPSEYGVNDEIDIVLEDQTG